MSENHGTTIFHVRIARTKLGGLLLIDCAEDSEELDFASDLYDGNHINPKYINNCDLIPTERGVYDCEVEYLSYRSNGPQDPEEWDSDITIKSAEAK